MKDEDCEDRAQEQLASLKRDMRKTMEDATVRAVHKVMAEFEAKSDERVMEMPEKFAGFDVVVDASLPPGTMKFEQPAPKIEANRPKPLTGGDERRHIICLCPDCTKPAQQQEPLAFYVYKPTLPRGNLGLVADGDLPWVYDQDPSSGFSARMLVTPVTSLPASKPLSGYINRAGINANDSPITVVEKLERVIEATHQETQRIWQGLTDEEFLDIARTFGAQPWPPGSCVAFGQMVEAKLKEKNG